MEKGTSNKKKSPSHERYEKENPTVSARVPEETRDKLLVNLAKLNMTLSAALKVLAGQLEVKVVPIDEARGKGFEDAMKLYMVSYPCNICGKPIHITSPKAKEAVRGFMIEQGWGHSECLHPPSPAPHRRKKRPLFQKRRQRARAKGEDF